MTMTIMETLPKHQFTVTTGIAAPIEVCFEAAYSEEALAHWVPSFQSVEFNHDRADVDFGPGATRLVTQKSGFTILEEVIANEPPTLFAYAVPTFGNIVDRLLTDYQGRMHFHLGETGLTELQWNGYFNCGGFQRITEPLMRIALRTMLGLMSRNLKAFVENTALVASERDA